eukprot:gene12740-biopygen437
MPGTRPFLQLLLMCVPRPLQFLPPHDRGQDATVYDAQEPPPIQLPDYGSRRSRPVPRRGRLVGRPPADTDVQGLRGNTSQ